MVTGKQIGGYEILEELGRGAMGVVFKARQVSMDRIVAIKFLPKKLAQDERIVARFLREARAAGQLAHPNIVSVHELGLAEGLHFIAMEYVDGNSIQKKLKDKGPFTEQDTLEIGAQIAEALKLAHSRGILHRDIKPDNFLIDSMGRVRLADLGLASIESARDGSLTQDGTTLGTPHYMSPEQCSGTQVDPRSDLYSLGSSMFVMSCGRTPYEGTTAAAVMVKVLTEPPQSLKKIRPELSSGFVALVEKLMQKDPARRFQSAQSVAEAIQQCRNGTFKAVSAPKPAAPAKSAGNKTPAGQLDKTGKSKSGDSGLLPLLLGAAAAIVLLVVLAVFKSSGPSQARGDRTAAPPPVASIPAPEAPIVQTVAKQPIEPKVGDSEIQRNPVFNQQLNTLVNDFDTGKIKPAEALRRLNEFRKTHKDRLMTQAPPRNRVKDLETRIRAKLALITEEWRKLEPLVDKDVRAVHVNDALAKLSDFHSAHEGSDEAGKALQRIDALVSGLLTSAEKTATNNPKEALAALAAISAKLPAKQDALYKAAVAELTRRSQLNDELAELYERAVQKARLSDSVPRTRFQFADAARFCADSASRMKDEGNKRDALDMAELFKAADGVFAGLRAQLNAGPIELQSLANFNNVKVTQWDDKGLTFVTTQITQPSTFSWESAAAPDVVLQLARELRRPEKPSVQWEFGVLAFALGNKTEASKSIRDAVGKDESSFKAPAGVALKLLKPMEPAPVAKPEKVERQEPLLYTASTGDDEARQLLRDFQDAQKAGDKEKLKSLRAELDGKYGNTDYVKGHRKDIDDVVAAAGLPVDPSKAPEPPKPAPTKAELLSADEKEAREMLKRLGWTDIAGSWVWDKANQMFRVDGVAEVSNPALESDVNVQFRMLGAESKMRVLARVEKTVAADRFVAFGAVAGVGFGADINSDVAYIYGDYIPRKGSTREPTKYGSVKLETNRPFHNIDVSVHKAISVTVNGKENHTAGDARNTGDTRVIVNGPVLLVPKVTNTKAPVEK